MPAANVITRGYGSFNNVHLVVTRGYLGAAQPSPSPAPAGGAADNDRKRLEAKLKWNERRRKRQKEQLLKVKSFERVEAEQLELPLPLPPKEPSKNLDIFLKNVAKEIPTKLEAQQLELINVEITGADDEAEEWLLLGV